MTLSEFNAAIRERGVPITDDIPTSLPPDAAGQWDLLAPYVGRPLRDIPKGIVLLFAASTPHMVNGVTLATMLRALPPQERMFVSEMEEVFI